MVDETSGYKSPDFIRTPSVLLIGDKLYTIRPDGTVVTKPFKKEA